ncbi:MAG: Crp/Fnr family transcriptional regulator [Chloroflexaceae bacterium]|nr:Crp/Fnr family transcriptional regulator [Chloroflexaceae bacterium]NJO05627.1 Crp/Fnr family transcriptional regulator [Chloroflexaceae bacterium]
MLSTIERIIFLKQVSFFQSMSVDELGILAAVCEERFVEQDTQIIRQNDAGGTLFVIVNGKVGIEYEKSSSSVARVATLGANAYFGEVSLFDTGIYGTSAVTIRDTLLLCLDREPLVALVWQYPDIAIALINVISQRLREANDRITELTRSRPSQLASLYEQFE